MAHHTATVRWQRGDANFLDRRYSRAHTLAFDGGAVVPGVLSRLFADAPRFLKPGGALCFELGLGQGPVLESRLRRQPWVEHVEAHRDAAGAIRALTAIKR